MASLKDIDYAKLELKLFADIYGRRPILRKWLPAGKRIETAQAYGMSAKKLRKKFPFSYRIWSWIPRPQSVFLDLETKPFPGTITGRWKGGGAIKTNVPKQQFLDRGEFVVSKKQADIYADFAKKYTKLSDRDFIRTISMPAALGAPYGETIEWHTDDGFEFSGCGRYQVTEDAIYGFFSLFVDGDYESQAKNMSEAKLIAEMHKIRNKS